MKPQRLISPGEEAGAADVPGPRDRSAAAVLVTVGALRERTGVTARTLRHYEAVGLLAPVRTTANCRLYSLEQCEVAARIVELRRLGLSLAEIRDIVAGGRPPAWTAMMLRQRLVNRERELSADLDRIRQALAAMEGAGEGGKAANAAGPTEPDPEQRAETRTRT